MKVAEEEIKKEVERAGAHGDCRVTGVQPIYGNCRKTTVEISEDAAALYKRGKIRIGLNGCSVRRRIHVETCRRCHGTGDLLSGF